MKTLKTIALLSLCIGLHMPAQAQFWKKLKKKVQKKVEQKVEEKIDKETDKALDKALEDKKEEGKTATKTKQTKKTSTKASEAKSYGSAAINHSIKFGTVMINKLHRVTVNREGNLFRFTGNWVTTGVDVFDGYHLEIKNIASIDAINSKRTFKVPEEASLRLGYEALPGGQKGESRLGQSINLEKGTVTVNFEKDKTVAITFSGSTPLVMEWKKNTYGEYEAVRQTGTISGNVFVNEPIYTITKVRNTSSNNTVTTATTDTSNYNATPTVTIPNTFSFSKRIHVELIDDSGQKYPMQFLLGKYPDIYGMSVASKEMQGQGQVTMVITPKSSTVFMNVAGMKMKKTSSLQEMEGNFDITDKIPDPKDFNYQKTGNTKSILGYTCTEYRVDYNYTNSKGTASFWVSKDFPLKNKELPMLGMKMNNSHLPGFVLEWTSTQQGKTYTIKVVEVTNKPLTIRTNEYRKMGF